MSISFCLLIIALIVMAYYLIFKAPSNNLVYQSESEAAVLKAEEQLTAVGIKTYKKNL